MQMITSGTSGSYFIGLIYTLPLLCLLYHSMTSNVVVVPVDMVPHCNCMYECCYLSALSSVVASCAINTPSVPFCTCICVSACFQVMLWLCQY